MAINTYEKGSGVKLSDHFHSSEFDCKGKDCCVETLVDSRLVEYLRQIRDHFGAPVILNSGYRCVKHNESVGGAKKSRHCAGMAADIRVAGRTPAEVAEYAEELGIPGIGLYETKADGYFVHIDTREEKCFWYGQAQEQRETFRKGIGEYKMTLRTLRAGCSGEDVAALQMLLICRGYLCGDSGSDGIFGARTEAAVRRYQRDCELPEDGIAGELTMGYLLGVSSHE